MDILFFSFINLINSAVFAYSWLKEAPRGLWLALRIGSHSMKMYSIPCDVPLPTLYYISLFSLLGVQKIPTYRPEKKETLQTWIFSIAFDLSSALETWKERRHDRRRSRDRICSTETRRVSQKAKPSPIKKKLSKERNKERQKNALCQKEDIRHAKTEIK